MTKPAKLLVMDIDNTVFDWVHYYTSAFSQLLDTVSAIVGTGVDVLASEAKEVFEHHGSIEYPFLIQELPSVNAFYGKDIDRLLAEAVEPGRLAFLRSAVATLAPYPKVKETLHRIRQQYHDLSVVALTDAPRYVAMWKLNKLGLLSEFDAVYGLPDPRIPTCEETRRVKVQAGILLKHLQQPNFGYEGRIRILPDDYEKPGTKGLKTVLMDFELDESPEDRQRVLWVGDNQRKDIPLGERLGVKTVWAAYGAQVSQHAYACLAIFSPTQNIHKNANIAGDQPTRPDFVINAFNELEDVLFQVWQS